jgi:hypothetical protein
MNKKKVWRYYCEFCKKSGCSAGHLKKHEKGCTANPNRECGLCRTAGLEQEPTAKLVSILMEKIPVEEQMKKLRDITENCPACILSAIRQSGLQHWDFDEDGIEKGPNYNFDYKKEAALFWSEINAANYHREMKGGYY